MRDQARPHTPARLGGAALLAGLLLAGCAAAEPPTATAPAPPPPAPSAPAPRPPAAPSALDWAGAVCAAVQPVVTTLAGPPAPDLRDLAGTRQAYLGYLGTATQQADQALRQVGDAGTPAVPNGGAVAGQVRDQLGQMRLDIEQARAQLERADPNDLASLGEGVASTGNVLGSLANSAQALSALRSDPQLGPAFDQAPACASLRTVG